MILYIVTYTCVFTLSILRSFSYEIILSSFYFNRNFFFKCRYFVHLNLEISG